MPRLREWAEAEWEGAVGPVRVDLADLFATIQRVPRAAQLMGGVVELQLLVRIGMLWWWW